MGLWADILYREASIYKCSRMNDCRRAGHWERNKRDKSSSLSMDMSADGVVLPFLRPRMVVVSILNPSWWPGSLLQSGLMFGLDHFI